MSGAAVMTSAEAGPVLRALGQQQLDVIVKAMPSVLAMARDPGFGDTGITNIRRVEIDGLAMELVVSLELAPPADGDDGGLVNPTLGAAEGGAA